jgi:hypothetical protein
VACYVNKTIHANSNHLPIRTLINIETPITDPPKRRNWKAMDRPKFTKFVKENLAILQFWKNYAREEVSGAQINATVNQLVKVVQQGITKSTPRAKPSAWANPSFTLECYKAIWDACRAFQRYMASHGKKEWQLYCRSRNQKGWVISQALRKQHQARVRQVTKQGVKGMWRIACWAQGGRPNRVIPALKRPNGSEAKTIHEKAECLRGVLFLKPPEANLTNLGQFHPKPIKFLAILAREVTKAICQAPPDKAPRPNSIPNHI